MIFAIFAAWFGFKKARETGRNGFLWAFVAVAAFIGAQVVSALAIGVLLGFGVALAGWPETIYEDYNSAITIVSVIAGFASLWLVFRFLDKVPEQEKFTAPPPPPNFNQNP